MRSTLLCLVCIIGCKVANPHYCEEADNNLCPPDATPPMKCEDSSDCTNTNAGVCKMPEQVCVQCTAMDAAACTGATPVCNEMTNACEACDRHSDCPLSDTCLPSGECAAPADVLYVSASGNDNPECDFDTRCANLTQALTAAVPRSIIRVDGTIMGPPVTIDDRDVTILGNRDGVTTLRPSSGNDVLLLDGTSKVRIYDVTIADAPGIAVSGLNGHTGELQLHRCTITNNGTGIQVLGPSLLVLARSTVSLNDEGGIVMLNSGNKFDITNNFIFRNGDENASTHSGVTINAASGVGSRLEFNTIVDNDALNSSTRSGGVLCAVPSFAAPNNIIARNALSNMTMLSNSQTFGDCSFNGSIVQADITNLQFAQPDTPTFSYKLRLGSSAIDMAMTGAAVMVDHEGQDRPNGMFRDVGADEFYSTP